MTMLTLPAQVSLENAQPVLQSLQAQIKAAGSNEICLDAAALGQVDSAVLAVLLACCREAQAGRQAFSVRHAPARLVDLAHLYGVQELLALRAD